MTRLIAALVRHGAYDRPPGVPSAHLPYPLTPTGQGEAGEAAYRLIAERTRQGWRFDPVIDCSSLLRAWQTAQILADTLSPALNATFDVESFDALAERCLGSAANLTRAQIVEVLRTDPRFPPPPADWSADSDYRLPLPGAESLIEAGRRAARHITARLEAIDAAPDETVVRVFVGHDGAFRHAAAVLGALELEEAPRVSMHHAVPIYMEYDKDGPWRRVAGSWKERTPEQEKLD